MVAKKATDLFNFISWKEYQSRPEMNFSLLKEMASGADVFKYRKAHPKEQTAAMLEGAVIHKRALEPDQFGSEYTIWEGGKTQAGKFSMSKATTAYKEFESAEEAKGRTVIDAALVEKAAAIRDRIMQHPIASTYLKNALVEQTVLWKNHGVDMKSRLDIVQPGFICDLKTARDIDPWGFGKAAGDMLYHAQMALYRDAWAAKTGEVLPVKVLAVEKTEPFRICCYMINEETLTEGQGLYENWLKQLVKCRETGKYPGLYEAEEEFRLPGYMLSQSMESEANDTVAIGGKKMRLNEETGLLEEIE
jgi:hypothetical protein